MLLMILVCLIFLHLTFNSKILLIIVGLPAGFCVWLAACEEADFLRGRLLWANWDVDELLARKQEVIEKDLLNVRLLGWGI
jgi:hypothetical protein